MKPLAALTLAATLLAAAATADASVAVAATLDDLVTSADAVATVTPLEQRAEWRGGRIVTLTHVRVDRTIAGQPPPPDVWVRTLGGVVDGVGQRVEGEPVFTPGAPSLVFVRRVDAGTFTVVARAQGQYELVRDARGVRRLGASGHVAHLVRRAAPVASEPSAAELLTRGDLETATRVITAAFAARRGR